MERLRSGTHFGISESLSSSSMHTTQQQWHLTMAEVFKEGEGDDAFRHQCLVRHVLSMRVNDRGAAWKFVRSWNEKHPDSCLQNDVVNQWERGNRGVNGDWRDA